jgi:hypothetical protein
MKIINYYYNTNNHNYVIRLKRNIINLVKKTSFCFTQQKKQVEERRNRKKGNNLSYIK